MMKGISATEKTSEGLKINSVFMMAIINTEFIFSPSEVFSVAEIPFIISPATLSVHFDQASTTLLYFSPLVIKPSAYCVS